MKILNESPKAQIIKDENDWLCHCPPEGGEKQWKDNHSAKEFAKLVTSPNFEKDVCSVLSQKFGDCSIKDAFPERLTSFDKFGGPRHHDLACVVKSSKGKIVVCFEAKATEPFDDSLADHIKNLEDKNENSKIRERINIMCKRFWNKDYDESSMKNLYYQLFAALTGTIFFAKEQKLKKCVFVVYQIETDLTKETCIKEHENAVLDFLKMFKSDISVLEEEKIYELGKFDADGDEIESCILYMKRKKLA